MTTLNLDASMHVPCINQYNYWGKKERKRKGKHIINK